MLFPEYVGRSVVWQDGSLGVVIAYNDSVRISFLPDVKGLFIVTHFDGRATLDNKAVKEDGKQPGGGEFHIIKVGP